MYPGGNADPRGQMSQLKKRIFIALSALISMGIIAGWIQWTSCAFTPKPDLSDARAFCLASHAHDVEACTASVASGELATHLVCEAGAWQAGTSSTDNHWDVSF